MKEALIILWRFASFCFPDVIYVKRYRYERTLSREMQQSIQKRFHTIFETLTNSSQKKSTELDLGPISSQLHPFLLDKTVEIDSISLSI